MDNSIQANGAQRPEPDPRMRELIRQNQDLQHRLADAEKENARLVKELAEMKEAKENYQGLTAAMIKEQYPPEFFDKLRWEDMIPVEDLLAELEIKE